MNDYCYRCSWWDNEDRQAVAFNMIVTNLKGEVVEHVGLCEMCWKHIKHELD